MTNSLNSNIMQKISGLNQKLDTILQEEHWRKTNKLA
jgi:hypothetical protein